MSNYKNHAMNEFRAAGWIDKNGTFKDEMQEMICDHVLKLLEVFHDEGHSGSSAHYAIDLFSKLAKFEPVAPLTGEAWEWVEVGEQIGEHLYQNKRCGNVFKDDVSAYDIEGIIWYDWYTDEETGEKYKSYFTDHKSRVKVEFPYTPVREYRERIEE